MNKVVSAALSGMAIFLACTEPTSSPDVSDKDGKTIPGAVWKEAPGTAPSTREFATARVVMMGGRLWKITSRNDTGLPLASETYVSLDGATWTLVEDSCAFPARHDFHVVQFGGSLLVIGGISSPHWDSRIQAYPTHQEIWSSPDGKTWSRLVDPLPFGPDLRNVTPFVLKDSLRIIAADSSLWSSPDGKDWRISVRMPARGGSLSYHAEFAGDSWFLSGSEALRTRDFSSWTRKALPTDGRGAGLAVLRDTLFLNDGSRISSTSNGEDWKMVYEPKAGEIGFLNPRLLAFSFLEFQGSLFTIGGVTNKGPSIVGIWWSK